MLGFNGEVALNQREPRTGESGSTPSLAAGGFRNKRDSGDRIHRVDRVPREFVAEPDGFSSASDGSQRLNLCQQLNSTPVSKQRISDTQPDGSAQGD